MPGERLSRRSVVTIGATGLASLGGCISLPFGRGGPEELTFEITLRGSDGEITASIDPAGDVEDVVQINVGDDVTFEFVNERDHPTGIHNHAIDEEVVIDQGTTHTTAFTPTEEMVGRHEVEAFDAEGSGDHGHEEGTPTDTDHHEETPTEEEHHEETSTTDEHGSGEHSGQEEFVILTVEVRPSGG